jgi:hypothetical protein
VFFEGGFMTNNRPTRGFWDFLGGGWGNGGTRG